MKIKRGYSILIFMIVIIVILLILGFWLDNDFVDMRKEINIFKPDENIVGYGEDTRDVKEILDYDPNEELYYKRVILERGDEKIELLEERGCTIKQELRNSISFRCPKEAVKDIDVKEARVFHIIDTISNYQIGADKVWKEGIYGEGVNVVILDTGIDSSHIELKDSIKGQKDFVWNDNIAEDYNGHGSHVAGIITGNGVYMIDGIYAKGVAPKAGIYMLKVCDGYGNCYEDDMMAAMEYAVYNLDAKVMSISLGGGDYGSHCDYDPLAQMVNWVVDNGYTVIVSAGNSGKGVGTPACASKAIAVGAVDMYGNLPYWSSRGTALDIVAPGVDILSTYSCSAVGDCGSYWYAYLSGTSMACPHISGVVALLLSKNPSLSTIEIKDALYSTTNNVKNCYECVMWYWTGSCAYQSLVSCSRENTGHGIVDAYEAYLSIGVNEDSDEDGVMDNEDACPYEYGLACNGCPNLCSGCSVMDCKEGTLNKPSCIAGKCYPSVCPADGCGAGSCEYDEYGSYTSSENVCVVSNNKGECTNNPCKLICIYSPEWCSISQCWSKEYKFIYNDRSQFKKFCKCVSGIYGYKDYTKKEIAYGYIDKRNNEDWKIRQYAVSHPVYSVMCNDGNWYRTDQDYFYFG